MNIKFDSTTRIITINNVKYTFDFFEMLGTPGGVRLGKPFMISKRKGGIITLDLLDKDYIKKLLEKGVRNARRRNKKNKDG